MICSYRLNTHRCGAHRKLSPLSLLIKIKILAIRCLNAKVGTNVLNSIECSKEK